MGHCYAALLFDQWVSHNLLESGCGGGGEILLVCVRVG